MRSWLVVLGAGMLLVPGGGAWAQSGAASPLPPAASQSPGVRGMGAADPLLQEDPERARIEAQQERLRVTERQKRMMTDADHLLALAGQLRAELVQPRTAESSAESARVAEEIEHLARNVKDRMRN